MNDEPTLQEFAKHVDERFGDIIDAIQASSTHVEEELSEIKGKIKRIETTMVTKDYLDDKLADLRGEFVAGRFLR